MRLSHSEAMQQMRPDAHDDTIQVTAESNLCSLAVNSAPQPLSHTWHSYL